MIMHVPRFQFNKTYLYGGAAFLAGFAGIMTLLVHFAPVRVDQANVVNKTDTQVVKKPSSDNSAATQTDQSNTTTTPSSGIDTSMMSVNTAPSATGASTDTSTDPTTPAQTDPTTDPTAPTEPTTPTDPDPTPDPTPNPTPDPITDPSPILPLPLLDTTSVDLSVEL